MNINQIHMDTLLKKTDLYVNDYIASQTERECFIQFVKQLKSSRKVRFIYRGESHLNEHYNSDLENISVLSQHIFMLGEKGRFFLVEKLTTYDNSFEFIWNQFNRKVCRLKFESKDTTKHVTDFIERDREFIQYFVDKANKDYFINLKKMPEDKRIKVSDYYLALLHTIGKSGNSRSYFLSSSKNFSIAEKFKKDRNGISDGIILYGWVPRKHLNENIIEYKDIEKHESFVKSLGLPTYNIPVYPDQKEICLKCGWLPHFILVFQHNDKFYINPSTLKPWQDNIPYDGIEIDQTSFMDYLNKSNYKQSFIFCDGEYFVLSKNDISKI